MCDLMYGCAALYIMIYFLKFNNIARYVISQMSEIARNMNELFQNTATIHPPNWNMQYKAPRFSVCWWV